MKFHSMSQHVCEACGQRLPQQRTFQARLLKTETLKTLKVYIRVLINSYYYSLHLKSCKSYVLFTYRSIIFTSSKKYVSYTYNSTVLIRIGTEQLRDKRIFIYFSCCIFISLIGAIFITNLADYYIILPFWIDLWSNSNQN